jgi:signal transduction histidine kinase/CheY-like chemotaxis protein
MPQSGQIAPLTGPSGIIGTITVIEDVSERVASESRLRERIAAAEAASRVKDEFLATLSHEIRTPLNAVLGWTRILRSRSHVDDATLRHAVDVIDRNATAQLTLVSDMLDMARISSDKVRLEMSDVDLRTIVSGAIDAVRPAADVKDVRIVTDFPAHLPAVRGDADRLLQVAWNLVSNGVKFTDAGGQVTLRLATEGRIVVLTVTDTGQGIDPVFLPHVFERFKQADPSSSRRHGGLGLGLALVKDLVQLHGGTVSVASGGHGSGTTFRVRFPAREAGTAEAEPRIDAALAPAMLRGVRIVVVEDDPDAAEIALNTLKAAGGSAFSVTSVDEALAVIRDPARAQPHVIVTDIGMPGCDGYEFVAAVRALPPENGGAIPMVALTAYATPEDRTKALRAGFDAHLPKPFDPETLVAVIARAARS